MYRVHPKEKKKKTLAAHLQQTKRAELSETIILHYNVIVTKVTDNKILLPLGTISMT